MWLREEGEREDRVLDAGAVRRRGGGVGLGRAVRLDGRHIAQDAARALARSRSRSCRKLSTSRPTARSGPRVPVGRYFVNTTVMALLIALLQIALALPAGFALAKLRFVGRGFAFGLVLVCLLIPAQVTFVPVFLLLGASQAW